MFGLIVCGLVFSSPVARASDYISAPVAIAGARKIHGEELCVARRDDGGFNIHVMPPRILS